MKKLLYIFVFALYLPIPAYAQDIPFNENQENTREVFKMLTESQEDETCQHPNNPYNKFFCQIRTISDSENSEEIPSSTPSTEPKKKSGHVGPLLGLIVSDALLFTSDYISIETLTAFDELLLTNPRRLSEYINATEEYRKIHFPKNHQIGKILRTAFSKVETKTTEIGKNGSTKVRIEVHFKWVSNGSIQSKTVSVHTFEEVLDDMSRVSPKQYTQYLNHYAKYGKDFINVATQEIFELKTDLFYTKMASKMRLKNGLKYAGYGAAILSLGLLAWEEWLSAHQPEMVKIDFDKETLEDMVQNDLPALKMYLLDPMPKVTEFLADYSRQIPSAIQISEGWNSKK